tara:strand:+ start:3672 stop:4397 length:726 start_codon:yes stop_codon:yes gene_type:complete
MEKKKNKSKKQTKKSKNKKPKFENCINLVDEEIKKRRSKWNLTALAWLDFDDVSQIIRLHIFNKWDQYDPKQPLAPWLNRIITNQIKNLIRNNYGNYSRPCLKCAAAEGENLCKIYVKQCNDCPLYAEWEKNKKRAYNIKIPLPMENHSHEVKSITGIGFDIEKNAKALHKKMKGVLKPTEWKVYQALYIDQKSEEEAAKVMGYKTTEKNRTPGYKQIKNIKKKIIIKVKKCLGEGEVDLY